jgi:hypothetical protein
MEAGVNGGFEQEKFIRADSALYDVFTQSPGSSDIDEVVVAGFRLQGKSHAGTAGICPYHPLDANRQRNLHVFKPVVFPVFDGPVIEQGDIAGEDGLQQCINTGDVQEAFMLACKACGRQVFGGGAAADRH